MAAPTRKRSGITAMPKPLRNIRLIASTLHQVDDAVMVDVARINEASDRS